MGVVVWISYSPPAMIPPASSAERRGRAAVVLPLLRSTVVLVLLLPRTPAYAPPTTHALAEGGRRLVFALVSGVRILL